MSHTSLRYTWQNEEQSFRVTVFISLGLECKVYLYAGESKMDPNNNVTWVFIVNNIKVLHNGNWHLINIGNV